MKRIFYRLTPIVLIGLNLFLWLLAFLTERIHSYSVLAWIPYLLTQVIISGISGIVIQRLHWGAHVDHLTGLLNRRFFYAELDKEMERVRRKGLPVSLIFIDVDNFKMTNDRYGHLTGDEVLRKLARLLRQNSRNEDTVARWGGEEFAIILPKTESAGAYAYAERLRQIVESYRFGCPTTISIGLCTTEEAMNIDRFMVIADNALYKAKEKKNSVVLAAAG